jgi:hypothetical protein
MRNSILLISLLFILEEVIFRKTNAYAVILSDILYFGLMVLATYLFYIVIHKENLVKYLLVYPTLGIFYFLGAAIHYAVLIIFMPQYYSGLRSLFLTLVPEFLSGMGISIGIYLCEHTKILDMSKFNKTISEES